MSNKTYKKIKTASPKLNNIRNKTRTLLKIYNSLEYGDKENKYSTLQQLFNSIGKNVSVSERFHCEYGKNITIGDDVIIGPNCTFIDNDTITIGNCIMIAPNVQIYTSYHPILPEDRYILDRDENDSMYFCTCADPVIIKDGAWIGGGVIILPAVTIGKNSIIGAGSVATHSIPDDCVAVGNPCKPIKFFNEIRKNLKQN